MSKRAERRHHAVRLKRKRLKESKRYHYGDQASLVRTANLRLHTSCLCSCTMCGNPRRTYGNGKASRTRQELKTPVENE